MQLVESFSKKNMELQQKEFKEHQRLHSIEIAPRIHFLHQLI